MFEKFKNKEIFVLFFIFMKKFHKFGHFEKILEKFKFLLLREPKKALGIY